MDCAGPSENTGGFQAVEFGGAVMACVDLDSGDRTAMPVRRQAVELARTAVGAIAVRELTCSDRPIDVGHGILHVPL